MSLPSSTQAAAQTSDDAARISGDTPALPPDTPAVAVVVAVVDASRGRVAGGAVTPAEPSAAYLERVKYSNSGERYVGSEN